MFVSSEVTICFALNRPKSKLVYQFKNYIVPTIPSQARGAVAVCSTISTVQKPLYNLYADRLVALTGIQSPRRRISVLRLSLSSRHETGMVFFGLVLLMSLLILLITGDSENFSGETFHNFVSRFETST